MKPLKWLSSDTKAVSVLIEYVLIVGILSIFFAFIMLQLNVFVEAPTGAAMKNQFEDVGNQIATKLVDIALIAPENGYVKTRIYMPYKIGEYDFKAGFIHTADGYTLEVKSDKLNKVVYIPLNNIALQIIPSGYTFSLKPDHELVYSRSVHTKPTAVALAYPTTVREDDNITFDMTYSTGEGNLYFRWDFGDGESVEGAYNPDDPSAALVLHSYDEGNYTAMLTVWDSYGYSDTDTINVTVIEETPNPYLYVDKFVIPAVTEPNTPVKIVIYLRGGGIVAEARNISVMHVIDVSGSMDPDYYSRGYTLYDSSSGIATPAKWDGNVVVDETFQRMVVRAYSTGYDVDLWVKSPDGDFARAQYLITNGELYYVSNPVPGNWSIAVVADYPTGSDTVNVDVWKKYRGSWYLVVSHTFILSANPSIFAVDVPFVENFKIEAVPVNGSKELHLWVREPDGTFRGFYSSSNGEYYETVDAQGTYTAYVVADFPYGSQEFYLNSYIAKIDAAKITAKVFNGFLRESDQVGVVSFGGQEEDPWEPRVTLDQILTSNTDDANESIDGLWAYGGTPMGEGIRVAREELVVNATGIPVMVILSDGNPTLPPPPSAAISYALEEAETTKQTTVNGEPILIYTIGFGSDANETLLRQIASSESNYYFAATANELRSIYEQIARELVEKAATNITVTDVLQNVELSETPQASITYSNGQTVLQWEIPSIRINETWSVSFYVIPTVEGVIETNVYGLSNVTFLPFPFDGNFTTIYLPTGELNVTRLKAEGVELK